MRSGFFIARLAREDSGAAAVEYALIIAAVAGVLVAAAFSLGVSVVNAYNYASTTIGDVMD
jgi:Flp pilus assembly pilin Flp